MNILTKKSLTFILILLMIFNCMACMAAASASSSDEEIKRAVNLGIGSYNFENKAVTYKEFIEMLDSVIRLSDESKFTYWEKTICNARNSEKSMTRREGMIALYIAAEELGSNYFQYNNTANGMQIFDEIASVDEWGFWDEMWDCDYSLFPNVEEHSMNGEASYINAGYFYSMNRVSLISGKTVFDYDETIKSMRPADPFLYEEAIRAAERLYESYLVSKPRQMTEEDEIIIAKAEERKNKIMSSKTEISVTGRSYYVSEKGNDQNDGLSINTPWKTMNKVNNAVLQPGDGVFFKRGDIWRGEALIAKPGVTYSAYGDGKKPGIYGSPENGASPEKWSNLEGTDNIWVYYKDIMDCGDIVLNGSMDIADKAPVWWTGSRYIKDEAWDSFEQKMEKPTFNPATDMEEFQFFNDISYIDLESQYPIYVFSYADRTGKLYLRCDEGNPGIIFDSIEFCCDPFNGSVITLNFGPGSTIDNLAVLYGGHAIECNGGKTVQNCEVGYMGAMTHTFYETETIYSGDGIIHTNHMDVINNYIHDTFNGGIAAGELSFGDEGEYEIQGNSNITGNLLEHTEGITLINWSPEINERNMFRNITIEDNYVMNSSSAGDPTGEKAADVLGALVFTGVMNPTPCANDNLIISNNVFYCSDGALIISGMPEEYYPMYANNVYVQYENKPFAHWRFRDGRFQTLYTLDPDEVKAFVKNELADKNGNVLV